MKKIYPAAFLLCAGLFSSPILFAQDHTATDTAAKESYVLLGTTYLSNNVYLGRKDSVKTPYLTPTFGYYHKSGWFINLSASYLPVESRIDVATLNGGYSFSRGNFDGELSADKYFYSDQSYSVRSEIKGDVLAYLGYDFGFLKPTVNATMNLDSATDYALTLGIEHTFLLANEKWEITPTLYLNAATQNYYDAYYKKTPVCKRQEGQIRRGRYGC